MNRLTRIAAQTATSLAKKALGVDPYILAKAAWERSVIGRSKSARHLEGGGINLFFQTEIANSVGKTGRDFAFKLAMGGIPFSVIDTTPKWSAIPRIPDGRERDRIRELRTTSAPWRKSVLLNGTDRTSSRDYEIYKEVFYEFGAGFNVFRDGFFKRVKNICVFSDFCRELVLRAAGESGSGNVNVVKIRYPFLFPDENRLSGRSEIRWRFGIPEKAFAVFFNFSLAALPGRKNPEAVVKAFANALGNRRDACLVLKTSEGAADGPGVRSLAGFADQCGVAERLRIVGGNLPMDDVLSLTRAMDAYLSLHRGEGLGLGMLEAMSLGVPVVATGYGGNTEFMDERTSFLVPFKLRMWNAQCGFSEKMGEWAEPDLDCASDILRSVFDNRQEAEKRAAAARAFVKEHYSLESFVSDVKTFMENNPA